MIVKNLEDLASWLRQCGVDISLWGTGDYKSVAELWKEVVNGDCILEVGPTRKVVIAIVIIETEGAVLHEAKQEFHDGRIRVRNKPPREKVKPQEKIAEAASRCLRQELRLNEDEYEILDVSESPTLLMKESASYPGIKTEYSQFFVKVSAPNLPKTDFSTEEHGDPHDPVRKHWWTWVTYNG